MENIDAYPEGQWARRVLINDLPIFYFCLLELFVWAGEGLGGLQPAFNRSHLHRRRNGKLKSPANVTSINNFKGGFNSKPINTEIA